MTAIDEVIRAVAEGATAGVVALRGAGLPVEVDAFDVEVDYVSGASDPGELSATLRVRFETRAADAQPMKLLARPPS